LTKDEIFGELNRETPFIITGDTDSLFCSLEDFLTNEEKKEIPKKIHDISDQIQKFLNEQIVTGFLQEFKIPNKYNYLQLKNELIIDRGLFLAKKRYTIHVIEREGVPVDQIKNMGLETKRSDFSYFTKESLNELIDLILKSDKISLGKIMDFVEEREEIFLEKIRRGEKSVGRPVNWTSTLGQYKKVPPHVLAMINFNELEYKIFNEGSRGYFFYLKGINPEKMPKKVYNNYKNKFLLQGRKLEYIVLPDEEIKLPEYYLVDEFKMLDFAWKKRVKLLLDPIIKIDNMIIPF